MKLAPFRATGQTRWIESESNELAGQLTKETQPPKPLRSLGVLGSQMQQTQQYFILRGRQLSHGALSSFLKYAID